MCGYRRFGAAGSYVVSVRRFDFHRRDAAFICVLVIQKSKVYTIIDNKSNQ